MPRKPGAAKRFIAANLARAAEARTKRDWPRVRAAYEAVLSEHPDRADIRLKLAELQVARGDRRGALSQYLAAGDHYAGQGYADRAVAAYLAGARRLPREPETRRRAALVELQRGHRGNARRLLLETAAALRGQGRRHEAVTQLRQAFSLDPFHLETSLALVRVLVAERPQEARSLLVRLAFEKRGRALQQVRWAQFRAFPSVANVALLLRSLF